MSDKQQAPWKTYTCAENVPHMWQAGPLKVWVKRSNLEWKLAYEIIEDEELNEHLWQVLDQEPENVSWQRWVFSKPYKGIIFRQNMLDRPLIVKTLTPTHVPAGMEATFYVNIPLCATVETQDDSETTIKLTSINSVTLSDTWFGNHFEGNLCYALKTKAVRRVEDAKPQPYRALCPIFIVNKTNEMLPLQKICIHAKYLNIYASDDRFWTNRISVSFLGKGISSKVHYESTPPSETKDSVLIRKASERFEGNFFKTLGQSFIDLF